MRNRNLRKIISTCTTFVCWLLLSAAVQKGFGGNPHETTPPGEPCPTCPLAIGLEEFRQAAGGSVIPVLIEFNEPSGLMHQMSAEHAGRSMRFKELTDHGGALLGRHQAFLESLPGRGVRALLRESEARQVDGSLRHIQYHLTYLMNGLVAFVARDDVARLRALPEVHRVFELRPVRLLLNTAIDYSLGMETNISDRRLAVYGPSPQWSPAGSLGHPETPVATPPANGFAGEGMIIAVIDSGVDWRHPMFGGTGLTTPTPPASGQTNAVNPNQKVIYYYALSSPGNPTDDFGHGTLVTSCAAGYQVDGNTPPNPGYGTGENGTGIGPTPGGVVLHGMAPQARVMEYKVCGPADACAGDIPLALEDAASPYTLVGSTTSGNVTNTFIPKPVADVINLSLGDTSGDPTSATSVMANNAALAGSIVVAAAGNSGPTNNTIGAPGAATLTIAPAASFDPGSLSTSDLLASNQITNDTRQPGSFGPPPVIGANSTSLQPDPGGRQAMELFPAFGGGPIPQGSLSAYYVFVDETTGNTVPLSVSNRIALVKLPSTTSTFAQDANQVAPFGPAVILLITSVQTATALSVAGNIPTYTIGPDDANYLISQMAGPVTNGTISSLPMRVNEFASLNLFQPGMAGFSSRGPLGNPNAKYRVVKPDVTAPGVNILGAATPTGLPDATVGIADPSGYARASGTSFATPITSGTMALVRERLRAMGLDSTNVSATHYRSTRFNVVTIARALLMNSASNLRSGLGVPEGGDTNSSASIIDFGAGHINVDGALHNNAIMTAPTWLLNNLEFTALTNDPPPPSALDSAGDLQVYLPSASFGAVPIVGINGTLVLTQQVVLRDITSGGGSGTYNLSFQNNSNANLPGFQLAFVSSNGAPISSVTVPPGGQATFNVQVTANGNMITNDPTEFQWFVTATPNVSTQRMRMPFYYRAVAPILQNVIAPVQAPLLVHGSSGGGAGGCALDTNSDYTIVWTYTVPNGGPLPVGFRVQEASYSTNIFFDDASTPLVGGANANWSGDQFWSSQVDPNTMHMAYWVPDTENSQDDSLVMVNNLPVPPGGATLSFFTSQDLEETFDYGYVEVSTNGGASFITVASYTYDFIGTRIVDLTPFAGKSIKIRFHFTNDLTNGTQDPYETGWYIENIAITSDNFHTIAEPGPAATSLAVSGRTNGTYIYRVAGLFPANPSIAPGPYSNTECVTETIGILRFVSVSELANGHVLLNCLGPAFASVRILGTTDFHTWTDLGARTVSNLGTFQFEDATAPGFAYRLYRLVTP
ncbi:MAG: hypothetical protein C5B50_18780 [Verrucomicrobia bacterium]|nr:MAG: hypothetical protein C5B50_18780 [Verrucomicrobiota bacterium]